jgi:hypothetical protein
MRQFPKAAMSPIKMPSQRCRHCTELLPIFDSWTQRRLIWNNLALHDTSVNLEDDNHLSVEQFTRLMTMVLAMPPIPTAQWPRPTYPEDEWPPKATELQTRLESTRQVEPTNHACDGYDGVLHIRSAETASAFFTSVLNQLLYAEQYN